MTQSAGGFGKERSLDSRGLEREYEDRSGGGRRGN